MRRTIYTSHSIILLNEFPFTYKCEICFVNDSIRRCYIIHPISNQIASIFTFFIVTTPFCKPKIRQHKIITIARNVGNSSTIFVLVGFAGDCPCLVGKEPRIGFDEVVFDLGQFFFGGIVVEKYKFPDSSVNTSSYISWS